MHNLTEEQVKTAVYNALCNGGLEFIGGLVFDREKSEYDKFINKGDCFEDNLMNILTNGGSLHFKDFEGDEDGSFTLAEAVKHLNLNMEIFSEEIMRAVRDEGEDDGLDGDIILQICIFNEVIFG